MKSLSLTTKFPQFVRPFCWTCSLIPNYSVNYLNIFAVKFVAASYISLLGVPKILKKFAKLCFVSSIIRTYWGQTRHNLGNDENYIFIIEYFRQGAQTVHIDCVEWFVWFCYGTDKVLFCTGSILAYGTQQAMLNVFFNITCHVREPKVELNWCKSIFLTDMTLIIIEHFQKIIPVVDTKINSSDLLLLSDMSPNRVPF